MACVRGASLSVIAVPIPKTGHIIALISTLVTYGSRSARVPGVVASFIYLVTDLTAVTKFSIIRADRRCTGLADTIDAGFGPVAVNSVVTLSV